MKYTFIILLIFLYSTLGIAESNHPYASPILLVIFITVSFIAFIQNVSAFKSAYINRITIPYYIFLFFLFSTALIENSLFAAIKIVGLYLVLFSPFIIYKYISRIKLDVSKLLASNAITVFFFVVASLIFYEGKHDAARAIASDRDVFGITFIGGGYPLAFGLTIISTFLLELIRYANRFSQRILLVSAQLIIFYFVYETKSTITLSALIVGYILHFFRFSNKSFPRMIYSAAGLMILVLIFIFNIDTIVLVLASDISDVRVNRLLEAVITVQDGFIATDYMDYRLSRPIFSLISFIYNPIFGTGYMYGYIYSNSLPYMGGHSFILDSLANYGIVGFLPLFWAYISMFRNIGRRKNDFTNNFIIVFLFMALLNPINVFFVNWVMFFIIPNVYERCREI